MVWERLLKMYMIHVLKRKKNNKGIKDPVSHGWLESFFKQIAGRDKAFKKSKNNSLNISYRLKYLHLRISVNLNIKVP